MLITSKKEDGATITSIHLEVTIDKKNYEGMSRVVLATTGKTLLKVLEQRLQNEIEKAFEMWREAQIIS